MSLVDNAKIIAELVKRGITIDLEEKIMELRQEALEMQEENVQLKTNIQELKQEIREIKQKLDDKDHFIFDDKYYWTLKDNKKEGPYCPKCFEDQSKKIHMIKDGTAYFCTVCKYSSLRIR